VANQFWLHPRIEAARAFGDQRALRAPAGNLPKAPPKEASVSTWAWGIGETIVIAGLMVGGYRASGRLARRRVLAVPATEDPDGLISA
jgi:hypothetical protein